MLHRWPLLQELA
ncbi:MAG TPA: hypothetical protein K8V46_13800 [Alcaligenes faecalis]|nr:hypothetical protein [Alcaligenes faecalis]